MFGASEDAKGISADSNRQGEGAAGAWVEGIRQMQKQNAPLGRRCKCLGAVEEHRTLAEGIPKGVLDGVGERMPV